VGSRGAGAWSEIAAPGAAQTEGESMKRETLTLSVKVKISSDNPKARRNVLRCLCAELGMAISEIGVDGHAHAETGTVRVQKPSPAKTKWTPSEQQLS
jgi:hypothetical protein